MKQIKIFYGDLYSSQFSCSQKLFDNFVENVVSPQLSEVDKNTLEGELTVEEYFQILKTFSNGNSPGEDNFTIHRTEKDGVARGTLGKLAKLA